VKGVNAIKQLGILHLGNEYSDLAFRPDVMFRRKRDALAKQVDIPTEFLDFVDWSTILQRQEKVAGTGMALTLATAVGSQMIGGYSWMNHALSAARVMGNDNLRRMILPGIVLAGKAFHRLLPLARHMTNTDKTALTATYYILNQIPQSLPHRLNAKIATQLAAMDYAHVNSSRIAGSVRKVLRFPADSLRVGLQRSVEQLGSRRDETLRVRGESDVARKYFSNLVRVSDHERRTVEAVDLDAVPPGMVGLAGGN
jgi:mitofusin